MYVYMCDTCLPYIPRVANIAPHKIILQCKPMFAVQTPPKYYPRLDQYDFLKDYCYYHTIRSYDDDSAADSNVVMMVLFVMDEYAHVKLE